MSIAMFILGGIIGFSVIYLVCLFGFFGVLEEKLSWETARRLQWIIPIISAILFGFLMGYAFGTHFEEGDYTGNRCTWCGENVEHGYKVRRGFSEYYYCQKDLSYAQIEAGIYETASTRLEDTWGHDEFDAVVIAEKAVKSKLKSPSTAKFCKHKEYTITCSEDTWTVRGYVDAQNSFGATLRNNFTVKFTFKNSEKYVISYCNIE